jgi:hypothetical protein
MRLDNLNWKVFLKSTKWEYFSDFAWYHEHVYPDLWIPDPVAMGEIRQQSISLKNLCFM